MISAALSLLTPEKANLMLLSPEHEGRCPLRERWFGTQYSVEGAFLCLCLLSGFPLSPLSSTIHPVDLLPPHPPTPCGEPLQPETVAASSENASICLCKGGKIGCKDPVLKELVVFLIGRDPAGLDGAVDGEPGAEH